VRSSRKQNDESAVGRRHFSIEPMNKTLSAQREEVVKALLERESALPNDPECQLWVK
jgi:hypothetical protein